MKIQRVAVTITLNVDVCNLPEGATLEEIGRQMTKDEWNEGRYPFHTEMLHEGVQEKVCKAIGEIVRNQMRAKHGNEMVAVENGETSLAYLKTQEAMRDVSAYVNDSIKAATIEVVNEL